MAVNDAQILALDQFDAHLVGKEGVLEISRVEAPRRQHRDARRIADIVGLHRAQRLAQQLRIVLDRPHLYPLEQLREELHHRLAVLQHVGDAGRRARIVLEHVEFVLVDAHDVDADDMGVDALRWPDADHFG
jgi:hypothetical protein